MIIYDATAGHARFDHVPFHRIRHLRRQGCDGMKRRVVVALRPVSPVERLLSVGAALCRRMDAELEVLADPTRPDWADIESRLASLENDGLVCRLTPATGLNARQVVEHARHHECVASVVVGRPAAWAGSNGGDPWARLECPLVAASDHPDLPKEQ